MQSAAEQSWLNEVESETLVDFLLEMADHGFPAMHERIGEYALEAARVWNPNLKDLGENWVDRFITQNKGKICTKWTANLKHAQAAAVSPAVIDHWFALLGTQYQHNNYQEGNIYGFNKSGFPFGTGESVKVITHKGHKCQHIQCDGNCKNVMGWL
jgi:hypothetical protein